jgi:hypothetical protein
MGQLKTGARLKSAVCDAEVMVVLAPSEAVELTCGGVPMLEGGAAPSGRGEVHPDHAVGVRIGKRYISQDGSLELLCVKSGDGGLAANGSLLLQKDTKQLPKTD